MDYSPPGSSVHGILQAKYWSGLPFPSPGDLLDPGIKPGSPALQADSLLSEPTGKPPVQNKKLATTTKKWWTSGFYKKREVLERYVTIETEMGMITSRKQGSHRLPAATIS